MSSGNLYNNRNPRRNKLLSFCFFNLWKFQTTQFSTKKLNDCFCFLRQYIGFVWLCGENDCTQNKIRVEEVY